MKKQLIILILAVSLITTSTTHIVINAAKYTQIAKPKYEGMNNFSENMAAIQLNLKWGFINEKGKLVIPCKYDSVSDFNNSLAAVQLKGKWGFINKKGKSVVANKYDEVRSFVSSER